MAEKVKRKPTLALFKRTNSSKVNEDLTTPRSPRPTAMKFDLLNSPRTLHTPPVLKAKNLAEVPRRISTGGIQDLVRCPLCLEILNNPKMLPCQHTFCFPCLTVYVADLKSFECPTCRTNTEVTSQSFLVDLPSNLYIDSLLLLVRPEPDSTNRQNDTPPGTPTRAGNNMDMLEPGVRCSQCRTMCVNTNITCCNHCKQNFCKLCWSQHLDDMQIQIGSILKQLESTSVKLQHKVENYKDRFEHLLEQIDAAAQEKINEIIASKDKIVSELQELQRNGDLSALALRTSLNEAKMVATKAMSKEGTTKDTDRIIVFMNLHQNALQLISDVTKWDTEKVVFDKDNFCIELDGASPLEAESDDPLPAVVRGNNPLESEDDLVLHYRSRNFVPHYTWRKTSRPAGVATSPWTNHLYICGLDAHNVLVVERTQARIIARLVCDEMLCPVHIAFMKSLGEIYITDKWKHCVHVFSKDGEYLRSFGQKGTDNAQHLIYVVDTGNDRVQVLHSDGKYVGQIGIVTKQRAINRNNVWQTEEVTCTELNAPTSIAVTNDRIIILDSGNRRVKIYNKQDKTKILEFGSLGHRKGQFRQPEVLAVEPLGFIVVGDSGNSRVQIFKPTGQLVRVFGGLGTEPGKFGWISGIHVTKQLDIIISDTKNHTVNFM
ncbi:Tripartite motif-containing protein 3 [Eumeta japonica]|uniref:Tripartite motif-containing protein 3 n=1 Tax=Eumeta variegata TaxID=151549 RepID=A0A4C1T8V3_EUMVA|nr:Tripartite motif-containing protein 3 [Eumeta japonica]